MALIMAALGAALALCFSVIVVPPPPPPTPSPTPTPTPDPRNIISVLFIGVDSLAASRPTLESVTVIKYQHEVARFYLFAVSPDTIIDPSNTPGHGTKLREFYDQDVQLGHGADLTKFALATISSEFGHIYAEVDFDRPALLRTMDSLEQVSCLSRNQTGEQLLHRFDALPPTAAEARLQFQGHLMQCLLLSAQKQHWAFPQLMEPLGQRFYPTQDRAFVVLEAAPPLPLDPTGIITAYTPLKPIIKPTPQP